MLLLVGATLALFTTTATASAAQPAPITWTVPGGVTALASTPAGDVVAVSPHAVTQFDAKGGVRWTTPLESVHVSAAVTADGDVWLAEGNAPGTGILPSRVTRVPAGGGPAVAWTPTGVTLPDAPTAITADPQGRLVIAFSTGLAPGGILVADTDGSVVSPVRRLDAFAATPFAADAANAYLPSGSELLRFDLASGARTSLHTFTARGIRQPPPVADVALGHDGALWVADAAGGRIVRLGAGGTIEAACEPRALPDAPVAVAASRDTVFAAVGEKLVAYPIGSCRADARVVGLRSATGSTMPRPRPGAATVRVRVRVTLSDGPRRGLAIGSATNVKGITYGCQVGTATSRTRNCASTIVERTGTAIEATVSVPVPQHWRGKCRTVFADVIGTGREPGRLVTRRLCWSQR